MTSVSSAPMKCSYTEPKNQNPKDQGSKIAPRSKKKRGLICNRSRHASNKQKKVDGYKLKIQHQNGISRRSKSIIRNKNFPSPNANSFRQLYVLRHRCASMDSIPRAGTFPLLAQRGRALITPRLSVVFITAQAGTACTQDTPHSAPPAPARRHSPHRPCWSASWAC